MAEKMAGSGLSLVHLKLAFDRDNQSGIKNLLSEKNCGKTRVTNRTDVIDKVVKYFT